MGKRRPCLAPAKATIRVEKVLHTYRLAWEKVTSQTPPVLALVHGQEPNQRTKP